MFGRRAGIIITPLVLIWFFGGHAWGGNPGHLGYHKKTMDDLTLYFRKFSSNRYLDLTPGAQAVNENVYHALFVWEGYHAEQAFALASLDVHLHLDATVISAQAASTIEIAIRRNGSTVFTSEVYGAPPGASGTFPVDILSEVTIYPPITYNQGDELGFRFQQIENLSPCQFRYNDAACRDDSHLTIERQRPDYPMIELSPVGFDLALDQGTTLDTTLELANVGNQPLYYNLNLPQGLHRFRYDDNIPTHDWPLSDQYGQDLLNVRFSPAQVCTLKSAEFLFSEDGSSGEPDLVVYVWDDSEGFPGAKLDSIQVPYSSLQFYPNWQVVDFADKHLVFQANQDFHIGYTLISHSPGDALALFSDDGLPVGNQRRSSELWGENWKTMYDHYDEDANFMIRAEVEYGAGPGWISFDPYWGYLNPDSVVQIGMHLDASGLSDGIYQSGAAVINSSPDRAVPLPITTRVGQTGVGEDVTQTPLPRSFLAVNYPNPFNAGTRISYQVGSSCSGHKLQPVRLTVYNLLGQRVRELVDRAQDPGSYSVWWDGRDTEGVAVASGVYLCRLAVGDFRRARKMVLLR